MKTCRVSPAFAGLKSQSTRQCAPTVKASVSRLPLPCQIFRTAHVLVGSGGADSSATVGAAAACAAVGTAGARTDSTFPSPVIERSTRLAAAKSAATARTSVVRAVCAVHQRRTGGHDTSIHRPSASISRSLVAAALVCRLVVIVFLVVVLLLLLRLRLRGRDELVEYPLRVVEQSGERPAEAGQDPVVRRAQRGHVHVDGGVRIAVLALAEIGRRLDLLARGRERVVDLTGGLVDLRAKGGVVDDLVLLVRLHARAAAETAELSVGVGGEGVELEQRLRLSDEGVDALHALERREDEGHPPAIVAVLVALDRPGHHEPRRAEHEQSGDHRDVRATKKDKLRFEQMEEESEHPAS